MSKKVIYVIANAPAYHLYRDSPRPAISWDTNDGNWVGIWGNEWGNLIGNNVLKATSAFEFEVWQPDSRADRIYSHRFENGLCHKLFPAVEKKIRDKTVLISDTMIQQFRIEEKSHHLILQIGIDPKLGWLIEPNKHLKIMGTLHGTIRLPLQELFKLRKNVFRYFYLLKDHFTLGEILPHYDLITYQNDTNLPAFQKLYQGAMDKVTMGVDFEKFFPMDQAECRRDLGLPLDKKIFLIVGRLNLLKQNDQFIKVLNKLHKDFDFRLVIVGSPDEKAFLDYLKRLAAPLLEAGKIQFTGYQTGATLTKYYNASDLFIMTSQSEGCSVATMESIACDTPVFSTKTGYIWELLAAYDKGHTVDIKDYSSWEKSLRKYLAGELIVEPFDRNVALNDFSWEAIAEKFIANYQKLASDKAIPTLTKESDYS